MRQNLVLYADDDIDDRNWVTDACQSLQTNIQIHFVENGRQVLEFLKNSDENNYPALIVLDLNMPEMDGRQTLQQVKKNEQFKHIPVAIVSTSSNKIDKDVCHRLGASLYLTKPHTHIAWQNIIKELEDFIAR